MNSQYTVVKYDVKGRVENSDFERYKLVDIDGTKITIDQLIDKYLSNPDLCFVKGYTEFNDKN